MARFPVARLVEQARRHWIQVRPVTDWIRVNGLRTAGLDPGENEALTLGIETRADALLLDDQAAVEEAARLGINVIRTPGVYRLAKQRGLIPAIRPKLDELCGAGFWLREEHYRIILRSAGEL